MGFKRNVDKNSGPTMPQNSASPKCESRNPHQTFCEFRKFAAGHGNRINYLCIESNPFAQPKTTFNPN
jgi:hypothetical protein